MDWPGAALAPIQVKLNSRYSVSQNKTIHPSLVYSFAKCCIQRPAEGVLWNFQGRWAFFYRRVSGTPPVCPKHEDISVRLDATLALYRQMDKQK